MSYINYAFMTEYYWSSHTDSISDNPWRQVKIDPNALMNSNVNRHNVPNVPRWELTQNNSYVFWVEKISSNAPREKIIWSTQREVKNLQTQVNLQNLSLNARKFIERNPFFSHRDYARAIDYGISRGLSDEQLKNILTGRFEVFSQLPEYQQEYVFSVVQVMKNQWMLDYINPNDSNVFLSVNEKRNQKIWTISNQNDARWGFENLNETLRNVINIAKNEVGTTEWKAADKYFYELGQKISTKNTPWCAAFVNWVLMKSGLPGSNSNLAKSFINWEWNGHVGIKTWPNQVVHWNSWNKVKETAMFKNVVGYAIPTPNGLKIYKGRISNENIPIGAIVVIDRNVVATRSNNRRKRRR